MICLGGILHGQRETTCLYRGYVGGETIPLAQLTLS
jgi:hypothetical protein